MSFNFLLKFSSWYIMPKQFYNYPRCRDIGEEIRRYSIQEAVSIVTLLRNATDCYNKNTVLKWAKWMWGRTQDESDILFVEQLLFLKIAVLGSQQNWKGGTEISHIYILPPNMHRSPSHYQHLWQNSKFATTDGLTLTSLFPESIICLH